MLPRGLGTAAPIPGGGKGEGAGPGAGLQTLLKWQQKVGLDRRNKCIKVCLRVVRTGSLLKLNFQLHDEILFLNKTTMYLFFNLSPTAIFTVVKLGRAEKPLGTAPGLCMCIFTLVRQSRIPQAVAPRRKIETSHPHRECYYPILRNLKAYFTYAQNPTGKISASLELSTSQC